MISRFLNKRFVCSGRFLFNYSSNFGLTIIELLHCGLVKFGLVKDFSPDSHVTFRQQNWTENGFKSFFSGKTKCIMIHLEFIIIDFIISRKSH